MSIPAEIKSVKRPKGTIIKEGFGRYFVIKRTSRRVPGKPTPRTVDLGTIGEIVNGEYVEIRKESKKVTQKKKINIKDYGKVAVCHKVGKSLYNDLKEAFGEADANKLYCIAVLRVCDPDIRNRDIKVAYDTSFLSEIIPDVPLSENTICTFLRDMGLEYVSIINFLKKRAQKFKGETQVIDGTLKNNNSIENTYSEFSRKGRLKGSKDLSIVYSYDMKTKEPILMKPYSGNMLDLRAVKDFVTTFSVASGIVVMDKGFYSAENISLFKSINGLSYVLPLQRNAKKLSTNSMYEDVNTVVVVDEKKILCKKKKVDDSTFLYCFRDPSIAGEEETLYLLKKNSIDTENYKKDKEQFGTIAFETNNDLSPEEVYEAYSGRWEIETLFKLFKEILDLDTVNVHSDASVFTSEFINYLSVILAQRIKTLFGNTVLKVKKNKKGEVVSTTSVADNYSFKQTMRYLEKIKKIRVDNESWILNYPEDVKYISELGEVLNV